MTLLKAEGWIGLSAATVSRKWTIPNGNPSSVQTGRFAGSRAMRFGNMGISMGPGTPATIIMGGAFNLTTLIGADTKCLFWARENAQMQWCVTPDSAGHLIARRGPGNGTILGTSTNTFLTTTWYYLEVKATVHDTTGAIEIRVNGQSWLNLTNQDTKVSTNAWQDEVGFAAEPNGNGITFDLTDMYVCDTNGSTNNDFLGDIRVEGLLPNANGNSSQMVGSDGNSTDNYLLVDEDTPGADDDTTYVESSTVGNKDTYNYPSVTPTTGTVYAVQISPMVRKTDAGTRSLVSVARLSATETDSSNKALSTSYAVMPDIRETKPGGGAWTISDVNSAEFGVKVSE